MKNEIIELVNVSRDIAWLPWAVQYFFLIGISVASFFLTVPAFLLGQSKWERLGRLALVCAVVTGVAAPIALLADLHQPFRFYHFYLYANRSSWMGWGAFFLPAYIVLLLGYAWQIYRPDLAAWGKSAPRRLRPVYRLLGGSGAVSAQRAAGWATVAFAALVALYTGMELEVVKARPLWHTPLLPPQLLATGFVGALGGLLLLNRLVGEADLRVEAACNRLLAAALAVVMLLGLVWFILGTGGLDAVHREAWRSVAGLRAWQVNGIWAALAIVVAFATALVKPVGSSWITGLIAVHSTWMFRWTVFVDVQNVSKTSAGLYPYALPFGSDGLLGILGTAGLVVFLVIAVTSGLPWRGSGALAGTDEKRDQLPGGVRK